MKGYKLVLCAVCAFITVLAAITAILIFKNEIIDFFVDVKEKVGSKILRRNGGEYADYADV